MGKNEPKLYSSICPQCKGACADVHGTPIALPVQWGNALCCMKCHYTFKYKEDGTIHELKVSEIQAITGCTAREFVDRVRAKRLAALARAVLSQDRARIERAVKKG